MAKTAKAPKMDSWFYAPVVNPTHRYRLISDGNGNGIVYQCAEYRGESATSRTPYRGVGNLYVIEYFSQLPDSLQEDPTVREHFGMSDE